MEEHRTPVPEDNAAQAAPAPRGRISPKSAGKRSSKPASRSLRYEKARRLMRDGAFLFKVVVALITGIIAFIIIVMAGLGAERQSDIVMNRAIAGFCVSAMVMFLACFWLDQRGIPLYVSKHEELQNSWVSEPDDAEEEALLARLAEKELEAEDETAEPTERPAAEGVAGEPEAMKEAEEPENDVEMEAATAAANEEDGFAPLADTAERIEVPR